MSEKADESVKEARVYDGGEGIKCKGNDRLYCQPCKNRAENNRHGSGGAFGSACERSSVIDFSGDSKLCTFIGDREEITLDDVKMLVARSLEQNIFELINKIVNRKRTESLQIFMIC